MKYSIPVKALAVVIFALCVAIFAASGVTVALNAYAGLYSAGDLDTNALYELGGDEFVTAAAVFYPLRRTALITLGASLLVGVVLFVYLMVAAGRRADTDEIKLSFYDKIPFELVLILTGAELALCCGLAYGLMMFLGSYIDTSVPNAADQVAFSLGLGSALAALFALVLLSLLYTFSARAKSGEFWRRTLIYLLVSLFKVPRIWASAIISAFTLFVWLSFYSNLVYSAGAVVFGVFCAGCIFLLNLWIASQNRRLAETARKLAHGELTALTDTRYMLPSFKEQGENLNSIGNGIAIAVEERMKSERMKTELITNVSHDIKTPLTSIVNYVDLLKNCEDESEREEYLEVLSRQSAKLKKLTEDLVDASKAASGAIAVELTATDLGELISQSLGEYEERLQNAGLTAVFDPPAEPIRVMADGRHLWRVVDNLLQNACKYALPGTRVYVELRDLGAFEKISVKNISRETLKVNAEELTERFTRGDESRSTEGSGLGLNIAKSLVELMGGRFAVSTDGDLFKAEIELKRC